MTEDEKFGSVPIAFEIGPFLNRIVIYDLMRLDANENLKQTSKKVYGDRTVVCKGNSSLLFSETRRYRNSDILLPRN